MKDLNNKSEIALINQSLGLTNQKLSDLDLKQIRDFVNTSLAEVRYENDDNNRSEFEGFTDKEILAFYLFRYTHINKDKTRSKQTILTYNFVITDFIESFVKYGDELDFSFSDSVVDEASGHISILKGLRKKHIDKYMQFLINGKTQVSSTERKYSNASLAQKFSIIKSFLKQLLEWEYIDRPLYAYMKGFSVSKADRPNRDIGPEHVKLLLDTFNEMNHVPMFTFTLFLVTTGIRNDELCKLRIADIHKDNLTQDGGYYIHIIAKGNKQRKIPLLPKTLQAIREFRAIRGLDPIETAEPNSPVFSTNRGKAYSPSYFDQYFKSQLALLPIEAKEKLDELCTYFEHENVHDRTSNRIEKRIKITPHGLRHAFAIISRKSGVDVDSIKDSLGHSDRKTTEIYLASIMSQEDHASKQWSSDIIGDYI
ncbi:tyrosine-type recombinase/integrase [Solibacillus sp. NPDC093137]|uniref:tyrosine-type recombinase/integrase n=1 Tax=Solibacillus sp. NPDC093137 TaxID=3390678 RepID=UPI003D02431D